MKYFAVIGAGGFIGYRLTEYLHLNQKAMPRPIVRSFRSLARVSRFQLDNQIADATDRVALAKALEGCEVAFYCVVGDRAMLVKSTQAVYAACREAKVKRLIYLSTALVHGFVPDPGTNEDSPLNRNQPFEYSKSKILAEEKLRSMMKDGSVECVILRPCIVYGPRSTYWSAQVATDILAQKAYLVDGGRGICNAIYVDNLVELMTLCATHPAAPGKTFLTKDEERVTWKQLYHSVAMALDVDETSIATVNPAAVSELASSHGSAMWLRLARNAWRSRYVRAAKELIRSRKTVSLAIRLREKIQSVRMSEKQMATTVALDPEIVGLQSCRIELPTDKLFEDLGYRPSTSFAEGSRRTGEWLRFAFGSNT